MLKKITIVFVLAFSYSIIRYNVFGIVPIADIPTLIINKAIAFSIIIMLLLGSISVINKKSDDYSEYLDLIKTFAIIHVLLSITLLSQNYYPKLFANEKLTLFANITVLFGVLSFTYMINNRYRIKSLIIYSLIAIHIFCLGFKGWFEIEKWNGMMPPITLICFLIMIVLIVLSILNKNILYSDNLKADK